MSERTGCDCDVRYLVGVEYGRANREHYDGVSEWRCAYCGRRVGRWTGRLLGLGEIEPRRGRVAVSGKCQQESEA